MRRTFTLLLLLLCAGHALAQKSDERQPLPAVPPPPPEMIPFDAAIEPQVTIKKRENDTIEEYRVDGTLYMLKVTPANGVPYYLIDNQGNGNFMRMDTLDGGVRVPQWIIGTF
ncbi:DUF2782 domain-containing protein [Rhodocyclus tenuis]|uniref:DUF2782 domain-containing protein n=1 Tax=Rhodocyclus gracilis TaxID=2929842 RepID=A0ABX0WM07_9RHOO|nr:DUF2782 domain-containing protein [Rhodocyclus gracilis]NJA89978.1 DUF2782 domain-containing protein [Rhodocyclus gracilis]